MTQTPTSSPAPASGPPLRRFLKRALANWRLRHQHPFNFAIHMPGIAIAVLGLIFLFINPWWGLAGLVVGYLLQWIGHLVEGNDVGEWAGIKKMLGLPYVGIAPRYLQKSPDREAGISSGQSPPAS